MSLPVLDFLCPKEYSEAQSQHKNKRMTELSKGTVPILCECTVLLPNKYFSALINPLYKYCVGGGYQFILLEKHISTCQSLSVIA